VSSCTSHNYTPRINKIFKKTGSFINLSNNNDTLILGDTIALQFKLTNPVKLDDGSIINIKNVTKTGAGYNFDKSFSAITGSFYLFPKVVELNKSYIQVEGQFSFNALLFPLIGSSIHYVPADTGTFVIYTDRNQYLVCDIEGSTDQVQINFFPDFNVQSKHEYLLDSYPIAKIAYESGRLNDASPYYCFYVKRK
jgi:hypothetical protein